MLKDIFLALFLGALLGFGLTGGYFAINKKNTSVTSKTDQVSTLPSPTLDVSIPTIVEEKKSTINHEIVIESPQNQSIVGNSKITIKGSTSPNSYLVITTPIKSYFYQSDASGNFSTDIEIGSGANLIEVNSFDPQDNAANANILVTYSTAKI